MLAYICNSCGGMSECVGSQLALPDGWALLTITISGGQGGIQTKHLCTGCVKKPGSVTEKKAIPR